jgi:hypothetical protein
MLRKTQPPIGLLDRLWKRFRTTLCLDTWCEIVMGFMGMFSLHEWTDWVSDKCRYLPGVLGKTAMWTDYRQYSPRMFEPRDRHKRLASAANLKKLLWLLPSIEDASVIK